MSESDDHLAAALELMDEGEAAFNERRYDKALSRYIAAGPHLTFVNSVDLSMLHGVALYRAMDAAAESQGTFVPAEALDRAAELASMAARAVLREITLECVLGYVLETAGRHDAEPREVCAILWGLRGRSATGEWKALVDFELGRWLLRDGNLRDAEQRFHLAYRGSPATNVSLRCGAASHLAMARHLLGDRDGALAAAMSVGSDAEPPDAATGTCRIIAADVHMGKHQDDFALLKLRDACRYVDGLADKSLAAVARCGQMMIYLSRNAPSEAFALSEEVLGIFPDPSTSYFARYALIMQARVAQEAGNRHLQARALRPVLEYFSAVPRAELLRSRTAADQYLEALGLQFDIKFGDAASLDPTEVGELRQLLGDALSLAHELGDTQEEMFIIGGALAMPLGSYDIGLGEGAEPNALDWYRQELEKYSGMGQAIRHALLVKAEDHSERGDVAAALSFVGEAIESAEHDLLDSPSSLYTSLSGLLARQAGYLDQDGQPEQAAQAALGALVCFLEMRGLFSEQEFRTARFRPGVGSYDKLFALLKKNMPTALPEVIETVRGQALPLRMTTAGHGQGDTAISGLLSEGLGMSADPARRAAKSGRLVVPLDRPQYLSIGGTSHLAAANRWRDEPPDFDLTSVIRSVGGAKAMWLGSWVDQNAHHWSLIDVTGVVASGSQERAILVSVLRELRGALPVRQSPKEDKRQVVSRALSGAMAGPACAGLLQKLAAAVLPPELGPRLSAASRTDRLLIACDPLLARVPWSLLPLSDGRMLAEAVTVEIVPPAAACREIAAHDRPRGGNRTMELLAADTSLPNARALADRLIEGNPGLTNALNADETVMALRNSLPTHPGMPGVAVFACHARPGSLNRPAAAALSLGSSRTLRASEIVNDPSFLMWDRVLLSACSTSSLAEARAEWLGLAPAMLYAGARIVISTAWDLLDLPSTLECDEKVVTILLTSTDPSRDLCDYQIEKLHQWYGSRINKAAESPLVFGAYQAVAA
jgi:tetratricopeptide (TPR) repeat protein